MFKTSTSARQVRVASEGHGVEHRAGAGAVSGATPDSGVVSLVIAPPDGAARAWNFTVSESTFPSWAWR
jgi:hypothetical protein